MSVAGRREQLFATHFGMVLRPAGSGAGAGVAVERLGPRAVAAALVDVGCVVAAGGAVGLRSGSLSPRRAIAVVDQAIDLDCAALPVPGAGAVAADASEFVDRADGVAAGRRANRRFREHGAAGCV